MTTRAVLPREIETLPANCIGEVVDFEIPATWHNSLDEMLADLDD